MTTPGLGRAGGSEIGKLYADLEIRGDRVPYDIKKHLEMAGRVSEKDAHELGQRLGSQISAGLRDQVDNDLGDGNLLENVIGGGRRRGRRSFLSRLFGVGTGLASGLGKALTPILTGIGQLAQSAGNSFLNMGIKGKFGLVIMIPVLGLILTLLVSIAAAVEVLGALLLLLPATLAAVGLQVGVLVIAFDGFGEAVAGAFSAKNASELNAALKDLTPSAQAFVRAMLPIKDVWASIKATAQEGFFSQAVGGMQQFTSMVTSPQLRSAIDYISRGLGLVADAILRGLSSESFLHFLEVLGPATFEWLQGFASAVGAVAEGFNNISAAMMPFFSQVGAGLNNILTRFGNWLTELANDPQFQEWLSKIWDIMQALGNIISAIISWLFSIFDALNAAGLAEFLNIVAAIFYFWAEFMSTPLGTAALRGFLHLLIMTLTVLTAIFTLVGLILGAFGLLVDLVGLVAIVIGGFFASVAAGVVAAWKKFKEHWDNIINKLKAIPEAFREGFVEGLKAVVEFGMSIASALWDAIVAGFTEFVEMGVRIGNWIADGIKDGLAAVRDTIFEIVTLGFADTETYNGPKKPNTLSGGSQSSNPTVRQQQTEAYYRNTGLGGILKGAGVYDEAVKSQTGTRSQYVSVQQNVTVQAGAISTTVQTQATPEAGRRLASAQTTQLASAISSGQEVRNMKSPGIF